MPAELKLTSRRGGAQLGVRIVDNAVSLPYSFRSEGTDWGAFAPDYSLSTDKQGRGLAVEASHAPRMIKLAIDCVGTDAASMKAAQSALTVEALACVKAGGVLRWRSNAATLPVYFNVLSAVYVPQQDGLFFETKFRAMGMLGLMVEPAAYGDAMGFRDPLNADTRADYSVGGAAGTFDAPGPWAAYGTSGLRFQRHIARGYNYTDVCVTLKLTTGSTVVNGDWSVMARCQGSNATDTCLAARLCGSGGATPNTINVVRISGGGISAIGGASFTPAINTTYWLRLIVFGARVVAQVFTSEPRGQTTSPAGGSTLGAPLALPPADQQAYVSGPCGWRTTNVSATERYQDFDVRPYVYAVLQPDVVRLTGIPGDLPAEITTEIDVSTSYTSQPLFGGLFWANRQRQVNLCWNGNLEQTAAGATQGWFKTTVTGVVTAAGGAGPTRNAASGKFGSACVEFVTTAVAQQGLNFPMPRKFQRGLTYIALGWMRSAAGTGSCGLMLGANADLGTSNFAAVSSAWKLYTSTWTVASNQDIAYLVPRHETASAETIQADGLGVFEVRPQTLAANATIGATTMVLTAVPDVGNPDLPCVAIIGAGTSTPELIRVTAIASDGVTCTVERGWDGSTAAARSIGDVVAMLPGYWFDANSDGSHGSMLDLVGGANPYTLGSGVTAMSVDANTRAGVKALGGSITTWQASYLVDPWTMVPPDFAGDELLVEVWARYSVDLSAPSPRLTVYSRGEDGASAPLRYGIENGSVGLNLLPCTISNRRFARIDVVPIRYSGATSRRRQQIGVQYDVATGSGFALDYLLLAPVGARATSPTGRVFDGTYPSFMPSSSLPLMRRINSDLSGEVGLTPGAAEPGNLNPQGGMMPTPVYFDVPNTDVAVKVSNLIPNGGVVADPDEQWNLAADGLVGVSFNVVPRYSTIR